MTPQEAAQLKIGDKVRYIDRNGIFDEDTVLSVVADDPYTGSYFDQEDLTAEIGAFRETEYWLEKFEIQKDVTVSDWSVKLKDGAIQGIGVSPWVVDLTNGGFYSGGANLPDGNDLGAYRPDINTRKAGKVRVELVDNGFPLALREIAKVMTWATVAKGYKDHDWQNLPNAEVQLAAAASRHRTDYIVQRYVEGMPGSLCVDPESAIVHKAHEAFGVLAELELLLRGEFEGEPS